MKAVKRIAIGLFILSLIVLYIIIYAVPRVTGALTQTEILQYGNLKIMDSVTGYFIRHETVYSAARAGNINYYVADAVQVKAGTRILSVGNTAYTSESGGVTSYFIDGYENDFTPENMRELKYDIVSSLEIVPENVVRSDALPGEPLYKICDNREWFIICWVDARNISKYGIDDNVTVELPSGQITATVTDIIEDGTKWLIIFRTDRYYEEFAGIRSAPATVIISDYSGILIRNESITVKDGEIGVYIKTRSGSFSFRPIKIITSDGNNSLAEVSFFYDDAGGRVSTINIYDEILKNP